MLEQAQDESPPAVVLGSTDAGTDLKKQYTWTHMGPSEPLYPFLPAPAP